MTTHFPEWFQQKLLAIFSVLVSVVLFFLAYIHYDSQMEYIPKPQQVLVDTYHRPIGAQDLLKDSFHNPHYRKGTQGETGADYAKEMLLTLFTYNRDDLTNGVVLERFRHAFAEGVGETIYQNVFVNLSQPRIVMAQDALVRARVIGNLNYEGEAFWQYRTLSGLPLQSKTFQYTGKLMVTVYAEDTYPTLYDVVIEVQRALLQDKIEGYQLIRMELK